MEECNLDRLLNKEYNVDVKLITEIKYESDLEGSVKEGSGSYSWSVIFLDY